MIKLQNKSTELDFAKEISDGYRIRHGTYQLRGSIIDRYGKDGGEEVGDKRIRARSLIIDAIASGAAGAAQAFASASAI